MLLYPEKILSWYLKKQYLSTPASKESNYLSILKKSGWPSPDDLVLSTSSRIDDVSTSRIKELLISNQIVEIRRTAGQKIIVPHELAWYMIFLFNKEKKITRQTFSLENRLIKEIQELKIEKKFIEKSTLQSMLSRGKVLEIYNFSKKRYELVTTEEILGKDLSKKSHAERVAKIATEFFKIYGPSPLSEFIAFSGIKKSYLQSALTLTKGDLCSLKVEGFNTSFIVYRDDLKKMISWNGQTRFRPNLFWKRDHAFKLKSNFLEKVIPGVDRAEFIAVDKGKIMGLFDKNNFWQPMPHFPKNNKKLFNIFLALLKLRKSELTNKIAGL